MARRAYVDGPFGQMHVRVAGTIGAGPPPLLCFHMSPMTGRTYARFVDAMAETGRAAIAIDTPGFGLSDAPAFPPSIADYAAAMAAATAALGIAGPVDLMGYHTGSMIACEFAATRPSLVRRLVCVATPIFSDVERAVLRAHYAVEAVSEDGAHLLDIWRRFHFHFAAGGMPLDQIADAFPERLIGRDIGGWGHRAAFDYPLGARLGAVDQPLLVINPGDDLQTETRRATAILRHGRIVERPDWGHGFLDLYTADAVALVGDFLDAPDEAPFDGIA